MTDTTTTTAQPWDGPIHKPTALYFAVVHAAGIIGVAYAFTVDWDIVLILALFQIASFFVGQLATTCAAHRYYAHGAFKAKQWLLLLFVIIFSANAQGSIICWSGWHKKHHHFEGKDGDPHDPHQGFWWGHMMWVIRNGGFTVPEGRYVATQGRCPAARFQHQYQIGLSVLMAFVVPMLIGYLAGDWLLGFLFACTRLIFQYHLTWVVNSICHLWGERLDPRDATNINWLAWLTAGEANHAMHHADPSHFQIGRRPDQPDMGAWLLRQFAKLGWVWDLKTT